MFDEFLNNQSSWLSGRGPESEIVFSTRIRLARNLSNIPFPFRSAAKEKQKVVEMVKDVHGSIEGLKNCGFYHLKDIDSLDKQLLLERHLVSQEYIASDEGRGLILGHDEEISIMINEEDHLRMQVLASGFDLQKCWNTLDSIDNAFSNKLSFSFLPDLGFLTACPTNVGTALRASCMLHLPALILTKRINKILELLARISFTTRGLFGEGTQALGDFFQISNQISLGLSEQELIGNLSGVVNQVKGQEIDARDTLLKKHRINLEDNVWRALGVMKNSRLITSKEALSHLSILSLGLDLGIIRDNDLSPKGLGRNLLNRLFIVIQPAHLQKIEGKPLNENERDFIRASILRENFSN
ncbi:MAG: protein arginine kinase [Candidatus Omnitrophica bacterium]|nr:protein arginine kinase [Candidatus Omnitrophota bacterium]